MTDLLEDLELIPLIILVVLIIFAFLVLMAILGINLNPKEASTLTQNVSFMAEI